MAELFETERLYLLGDPELELLGNRNRLAQWRHHNNGPVWLKIGRKVAYLGADINAFLAANRTDPNELQAA